MWHIELEQEVAEWLERLVPADFDQAADAIDRLRDAGNRLRMPLSRPLGGGLFDLRFQCEGMSRRITYWYADWPSTSIVLLTTFRKQRTNERREIDRARVALNRCRSRHQRGG